MLIVGDGTFCSSTGTGATILGEELPQPKTVAAKPVRAVKPRIEVTLTPTTEKTGSLVAKVRGLAHP